jgi:stage V sporulation protein B
MVNLFTVLPRLLDANIPFEEAQKLYGIVVGKSDTLLNLPLALNVAYATSLVPTIAAALAVGNTKEVSKKISISIFSTIIITLPAAVGLSVLADPIIKSIFPTAPDGGFYIVVSAYSLIFIALTQTIGGALQGMGKVYSAAIALLTGATVKYITNYFLVGNPDINIMGAAYSSIICYFITFIIGYTILTKNIKLNLSFNKFVLKPIIAVSVMGVIAHYAYLYILGLSNSNKIATASAICISAGVYGVMLLLLRIFDKEDLKIIPGLNKIIRTEDINNEII